MMWRLVNIPQKKQKNGRILKKTNLLLLIVVLKFLKLLFGRFHESDGLNIAHINQSPDAIISTFQFILEYDCYTSIYIPQEEFHSSNLIRCLATAEYVA